ncbi:Uncharacterised protein [Klebsiella pneumoniae]|uniref:Secreted protein n=1 Tax=Klebsiella pneumoniae TaxID=573 RepID=A0A378APW9_KLEPN|nr:Uncharacterised protein [Klebsiella pneumoniae]
MNKTWLFTTLTLALVAAAPAHAISAKYREQLERSGCTQMTDGITCDIHKTKAENAAAAQHADSGFGPWVGTGMFIRSMAIKLMRLPSPLKR